MKRYKTSYYNPLIMDKKILEDLFTLDISDLTSGNTELSIIDKIKYKYENRCWSNCFITNFVRILDRSAIKMSQNSRDGKANINVKFEVDVILFSPGQLLPLCRVINISRQDSITCEYPNASIMLRENTSFIESLRKDQMIPVEVVSSSYPDNQDTASIIGRIYSHPMRGKVFLVSQDDQIYDDDVIMLKTLLSKYTTVEKMLKSEGPKVLFFKNVLYGFKDSYKKKISDTEKKTQTEIVSMKSVAEKLVSGKMNDIGDYYYISSPVSAKVTDVLFRKKAEKAEKVDVKNNPNITIRRLVDIVCEVLIDVIRFDLMVIELVKHYDDDKKLKSADNIWSSYEGIKH